MPYIKVKLRDVPEPKTQNENKMKKVTKKMKKEVVRVRENG
jgi:hypothetical protein